jgi:hypothetical protein
MDEQSVEAPTVWLIGKLLEMNAGFPQGVIPTAGGLAGLSSVVIPWSADRPYR